MPLSPFFDRVFNGQFNDGVEQELYLVEDTMKAFEKVVQRIYTGNVVCGTSSYGTASKAMEIKAYLEFFTLADKIDLLGPFAPVTETVKDVLISHPNVLEISHLKASFDLRPGLIARRLLAEACFEPFLSNDMGPSSDWKLKEAIDWVGGFSAELLMPVGITVKYRHVRQHDNGWERLLSPVAFPNPLTSQIFYVFP